jgi:hypothetical protein
LHQPSRTLPEVRARSISYRSCRRNYRNRNKDSSAKQQDRSKFHIVSPRVRTESSLPRAENIKRRKKAFLFNFADIHLFAFYSVPDVRPKEGFTRLLLSNDCSRRHPTFLLACRHFQEKHGLEGIHSICYGAAVITVGSRCVLCVLNVVIQEGSSCRC